MTETPSYPEWLLFAPLYMIREADERSALVEVNERILEVLESQHYIERESGETNGGEPCELVRITHKGRRDLNDFLDRIGFSRRELRAAVRRAARDFGRQRPR